MSTRNLSRREASVILSLEASGVDDLTLRDVERIADISPGYARKLAHGLARKSWIQRVGRGRYLLNPARYGPDAIPDSDPLRIGSRLVSPYCFGYGTAASLHGLTTRYAMVHLIVTPRRTRMHPDGPVPFRIVVISGRKFFGTQEFRRGGTQVVVSDIEKTLLDCLDRPDLAGGLGGVALVLARAKPRLDPSRLVRYVRRLDNASLVQRLGYLLTRIRPELRPPRSLLQSLRPLCGAGFVHLGPPSIFGRRGRCEPEWRVIENVPDPALLAEVDVR